MTAKRIPPGQEFERLLSLAADDLLDPGEEERFAELLKEDVSARRHYLRYMGICADLQWEYAEAAAGAPPRREKQRRTAPWFSRFAPFAATAAIILAALGLLQKPAAPSRVRVELADGAFFQDEGFVKPAVVGSRYPSGTFFVESATGMVQLQFAGGTWLTLGGDSELRLSKSGAGKRVDLAFGRLSADVASQPRSKPLRIGTATAELEVLGTTLAVETDRTRTGLTVNEGTVRLRRLADGKSVDVPARHRAIASLDIKSDLSPRAKGDPGRRWFFPSGDFTAKVTLGAAASLRTHGLVHRAQPYIAGRAKNGTKLVRSGIAITGSLFSVMVSTHIRVRYRSSLRPTIFLSLVRSNGTFGGNFESALPSESAGPDGWREVVIPIAKFAPVKAMRQRDYLLPGNVVTKMLFSVHGNAVLELDELEVFPQEDDSRGSLRSRPGD